MRERLLLFVVLVACFKLSYGQMPYGYSGFLQDTTSWTESLPDIIINQASLQLDLPNEADNSTSIYFPDSLYDQGMTGSCVFASGIWYTFTYEINRLRKIASNTPESKYVPNALWNHENGGNPSNGSSVETLATYLIQRGAVSEADWGNRDWQDYIRWLSGYDTYLKCMNNKVSGLSKLKIANNGDNLDKLKHFIYDHGEGSPVGGLLTLSAPLNGDLGFLPPESNHAWEVVVTSLSAPGHAITIVGYCDDIKFDFNGDGLFTNNIDITGDGIINLRDWEIGGLRLVNSYGPNNGSEGFWWMPYRFLPDAAIYQLNVIENYKPELVLKGKIENDVRSNVHLVTGTGQDANTPPPPLNSLVELQSFRSSGGNYPMRGNYYPDLTLDYRPLETIIDFSINHPDEDPGIAYLGYLNLSNTIIGYIHYLSLIDYRWNETFEIIYTDTLMPMPKGLNFLGIEYDLIPHETPISQDCEFRANMVSRFNPVISNSATLTINDGVRIDMYNSTLTIDETSGLIVDDNVTFLAKRGFNNIIIKGSATFGSNVKFKAEEGATLLVTFDNPSSVINLANCRFERTNLIVAGSLTLNNSIIQCDHINTVIVSRGGKLILDNSKLTNFGNRLWRGIEVQGNTYKPQLPYSNQGLLVLRNGTIIENARWGVKTWKAIVMPVEGPTGNPDILYFGGIIQADGAEFLNNEVAVEFMPYENNNISYLRNCTFETNASLPEGKVPQYFIKQNNVTGISIRNCAFSNTLTPPLPESRGSGIYGYDSDLLITNNCTFNGLFRGIYGLGVEKQRTVQIKNNGFANTVREVYISNMDFANITSNTFNIWSGGFSANSAYGLYVDASTAYIIEENSFTNQQSTRNGVGLIINESGSDNNQVYKNYFENLTYATIAQGRNRHEKTGITGLCYKCNTFSNNEYDIRVTPRSHFSAASDGIATNQGSEKMGAGNIFTQLLNTLDISNTCNWVNYYKHQNSSGYNITPSPVDGVSVLTVLNTTFTPCPSNLDDQHDSQALKSDLNSSYDSISAIESILNESVDGGSTIQLNNSIQSSSPEQSAEIRNLLIDESPYLSESVIGTAINKDNVLNNAMIRDVMVANPHSAKSQDLIERLDTRTQPMPEVMKNEILMGQLTSGAKEMLEAELTHFHNHAWHNLVLLCNLYASDTSHSWNSDSIGMLIQNHNTTESRLKLAYWNWSKGNSQIALSILEDIKNNFNLTDFEDALLDNYTLLFNILGLISDEESLIENVDILLQIINQGDDKPAAASRNLLIDNGLLNYDEPIKYEFQTKSKRIMEFNDKSIKGLAVYPNPANDFLTVSTGYSIDGLHIDIIDAHGKIVLTKQMPKDKEEVIIYLKYIPKGEYIVRLYNHSKQFESIKFLIN